MKYFFQVTFVVFDGKDRRMLPPEVFAMGEDDLFSFRKMFWKTVGDMEKDLSKHLNQEVYYINVVVQQDIPELNFKQGELVAYRQLNKEEW